MQQVRYIKYPNEKTSGMCLKAQSGRKRQTTTTTLVERRKSKIAMATRCRIPCSRQTVSQTKSFRCYWKLRNTRSKTIFIASISTGQYYYYYSHYTGRRGRRPYQSHDLLTPLCLVDVTLPGQNDGVAFTTYRRNFR